MIPIKFSTPLVGYVILHSEGVESADTIGQLGFSKVDPSFRWAVYADYGKHRVCIGEASPVPICDGDAAYAVDVGRQGKTSYVNGNVFLPCVMRDRLADLASRGEFDVFNYWLPCVTIKPVFTTNGPASPDRT